MTLHIKLIKFVYKKIFLSQCYLMTNLNPAVWGPHAWFFIESVVIALPDTVTVELQNELKHFFISISFLLPCEKCRHHFSEYIKTTDIMNTDFSTKKKVLIWVNNIHNEVRKRNKNKTVGLENTIQYYNSKYNLETKTSYVDIFFICIFIIGLIVILKYLFFPNFNIMSRFQAQPQINPSAQVQPQINPSVQFKPQIIPSVQFQPQIIPSAQPQINPLAQV